MLKVGVCLALCIVICCGYRLPDLTRSKRLTARNYNEEAKYSSAPRAKTYQVEDQSHSEPSVPVSPSVAQIEHRGQEALNEEPANTLPEATEEKLAEEIHEIIDYIKHEAEEHHVDIQHQEEEEIEELLEVIEMVVHEETQPEPVVIEEIENLTHELKEIELNLILHPEEEVGKVEEKIEEILKQYPEAVEAIAHEIQEIVEAKSEDEVAAPILLAETAVFVPAEPEVIAPVLLKEPEVSAPVLLAEPEVSAPVLLAEPEISAPVLLTEPEISAPVLLTELEVSAPVLLAETEVSAPILLAETQVNNDQAVLSLSVPDVQEPVIHPQVAVAQSIRKLELTKAKHILPAPKYPAKPLYPKPSPAPTYYSKQTQASSKPSGNEFSPSLDDFLKNGPPNFFTQFKQPW